MEFVSHPNRCRYIPLFGLLFLCHCQISWYTKEVDLNGKTESAETFRVQNIRKESVVCLVSNVAFNLPVNSQTNLIFDPLEVPEAKEGSYKIQRPTYIGLDQEFLFFLKERLKNKVNLRIVNQLTGIPIRYRDQKFLEILKTGKSFSKIETIAEIAPNSTALKSLLKSYAEVVDENTEFLYGSENPYLHPVDSCDSYFYFLKYTNKQDTYNGLLFILSLGILPELRTQDHSYQVIYRRSVSSPIESFYFVLGNRKSLSWLYLITFNFFNSVSTFDKDYQFSEESEEMFLDAITDSLARSL